MGDNTTVIVAHGAFQTQWHYQLFLQAVRKNTGISRAIVPLQSSSDPSPPDNSFDADVEMLNQSVRNELSAGRDVLLVCHSFGGIPGCEALANLPESAPNDGKLGRVLGVMFVAAFVAEAGQSLVTSKMAGRADWVRIDVISYGLVQSLLANTAQGALTYVKDPASTLYSQVSSDTLRDELCERLVPQASASFLAATKHETWKHFPCYYVRCNNDRAMVTDEQDFFIQRLRRGCPRAKVKELRSDHSPFASMPERMAEVVHQVVEELRAGET